MRRLVLVLLMLNVLYALWAVLRPVQGPAEIGIPREPGESLVLLEEMDSPLFMVAPEPAYCPALGPFTSEADLREFAAAFLAGRAWRMDIDEAALPPMYRVYVPTSGAGLEGPALLASVRDVIETSGQDVDSYLVIGGELDGVVSLGLFAEQDNARSVYEQISGLGLVVERQIERRTRTFYSIVIADDEDSDFIQESAAELQALDAGTGITEKLCEMIALQD